MITLNQQSENLWALQGDLTVASINKVLQQGYKSIAKLGSGAELCLDCSGLKKVDSASVALLVEWLRAAKAKQVTLRFTKMPEMMQRIIQLSNLEELLLNQRA